MKKAHVLLFDGYADWEIGNALAELKRFGRVDVVPVGFSGKPVVSMGGLEIKPHKTLAQMVLSEILIFIIPGGYMWERNYPEDEMNQVLTRLESRHIPNGPCKGRPVKK